MKGELSRCDTAGEECMAKLESRALVLERTVHSWALLLLPLDLKVAPRNFGVGNTKDI